MWTWSLFHWHLYMYITSASQLMMLLRLNRQCSYYCCTHSYENCIIHCIISDSKTTIVSKTTTIDRGKHFCASHLRCATHFDRLIKFKNSLASARSVLYKSKWKKKFKTVYCWIFVFMKPTKVIAAMRKIRHGNIKKTGRSSGPTEYPGNFKSLATSRRWTYGNSSNGHDHWSELWSARGEIQRITMPHRFA